MPGSSCHPFALMEVRLDSTARYRVLESLGKGGMGEVFLADDTQLGRKVAIKFISDKVDAADDDRALERLYREARSAAALDHPYICKIHEITEVDDRTGIVMEHVTGETLRTVLARAPVSPKRAVEIAGEIAEALEEAHKKDVVHRDLKPANVMLSEQGHVKVMDFGLAKRTRVESSDDETTGSLTDPGVRVGTPGYMAPEQLLGSDADERSDLFAFGVLLYELLAGVHPFRRSSHSGTLSAVLHEPHAPVGQYAKGAPETARAMLDRLLAKQPNDRYQSFQDVRRDLGQLNDDSARVAGLAQPVAGDTAPSSGRTPYVGREAERAESRRLLEQAIQGQGSVLLLGGEPGIGKTRLAEELLLEARRRGCLALTGRCYEMEGTPPFMPWVEIVERSARIVPAAAFRAALGDSAPEVAKLVPELRQRFPDIPPPMELPPEQQRRYLFSNFLAFLERAARVTPQVLLIDDLHWADDSTLLLLQHVATNLSQMPMLIVGTYRDVDLDVERPFAETLETLTRMRLAQRLALSRLSDKVVGDMLEALSGQVPPSALVTAIYAETEGNPFFTEEVFHHLSEEGRLLDDGGRWRSDLRIEELDVPEGVRLVVGRRIKRLSAEAQRVLTTAAIVGRSFHLTLLEALGDADGDALLTALEEAEAAKLVLTVSSGREVRWEFAHGLIRQTLEGGLSLMRRQRAHLRVAEAMEHGYSSNVDRHAADIAQHLFQAGAAADPEKTVRFLTLAGDQHLRSGAFDEALQQFENALLIREEDDPRDSADLRYKKGQALRSLSRGPDAVEEWRAALTAYESLGDSAGIARTAYVAAWTSTWIGQMRGAQDLARRGLESVGADDDATRCRLLTTLLMASSAAGDAYQISRDLLDQVEALANKLDDPELAADVAEAPVRFHWSYMQYPEAVEAGRRASALRKDRGELYDVCELAWQIMGSLWWGGHPHEAVASAREIEPLADRIGHGQTLWTVRLIETYHHLLTTGDLAESEARARSDLVEAERSDNAFGLYNHTVLATVHFYAGDWTAARSQYDAALSLNFVSFVERFCPSAMLLHCAYAGDDVLNQLRADASRLSGMPEENPWGVWEELAHVVEGLAVVGLAPEGGGLYAHVLKGLKNGAGITMQHRLWEMVAGIAAGAAQHWEAATEHFEAALRQAHEWPHVVAQPDVRRWYARMLLDRNAAGDRAKAQTLLGEATQMYQTIGMPKHVEMAAELAKKAV